jgi:hypothetical protein
MVSPRCVFDPFRQLCLGFVPWARNDLGGGLVGVFNVLLDDVACKLHSFDRGGKIVGKVATSRVEVVEVDGGYVAGVVGDKCNVPRSVLSPGFQDLGLHELSIRVWVLKGKVAYGPCPAVRELGADLRVSWEVASEVARTAGDNHVI